jgi:hypothetical protein
VNVSDDATNYDVVLSGSSPSIVSSWVSLKVGTSPVIVLQPSNTSGCVDYDKASFSVGATGTDLIYQWRRGTVNLINNSNTSGANTSTLIINLIETADIGTDYNVLVSGLCAPTFTSINASLSKCLTAGIVSEQQLSTPNMAFFPNPFAVSLNFVISDETQINKSEIRIYNVIGTEMMRVLVTKKTTTIETEGFPKGVYFFKVLSNNETIQSGRLIAQ